MTKMTLASRVLSRLATRQTRGRYFSSTSPALSQPVVGFIGLGNMGLPMCLNLASAGDAEVIAFDTQPVALQKAQEAGVRPASSVEEIGASNCSVIFTMLPGCPAVDAVTPILLGNCSDNSSVLFVDCSTVHPSTSRRWNEELAANGHSRIDAPVSGGVKGATDGTLTFMIGGDNLETTLPLAQPYFDAMGKRTIPCGTAGSGSATKLCNNLALATQMVGICEAMNLGEQLGVDPEVLASVMNTSTAKCWASEVNNPHPAVAALTGSAASQDYAGGFGTKLMRKDLTLAVSAGSEVGVSLPLGTLSKELYQLAEYHGLGEKDFGVMLQFLRGKK